MSAKPEPTDFEQQKCVPCEGGIPALDPVQANQYADQLGDDWVLQGSHHIEKEYRFVDFASALRFVNRIGELAESEGHHPDLHIAWGKCRVEVWTHKINGLTRSDFYLAAKADRALQSLAR